MPSIVSYPDNAQVNTYELESSYHAAIMQLWLAKPSFHTPISKSGGRPITLQKWGTVGGEGVKMCQVKPKSSSSTVLLEKVGTVVQLLCHGPTEAGLFAFCKPSKFQTKSSQKFACPGKKDSAHFKNIQGYQWRVAKHPRSMKLYIFIMRCH